MQLLGWNESCKNNFPTPFVWLKSISCWILKLSDVPVNNEEMKLKLFLFIVAVNSIERKAYKHFDHICLLLTSYMRLNVPENISGFPKFWSFVVLQNFPAANHHKNKKPTYGTPLNTHMTQSAALTVWRFTSSYTEKLPSHQRCQAEWKIYLISPCHHVVPPNGSEGLGSGQEERFNEASSAG